MKDICIIRCPADSSVNRPRLRKLLGILTLDGERFETHRLDARTVLVEIHRRRDPEPPSQIHICDAFAYAYSGYLRPEYANPAEFGQKVMVRSGQASIPFSPGGIAAHFYVEKGGDTLFAWPSLSNWERVYYTQRNGLTVISNSALISHGIAADGAEPEMEQSWFDAVLVGLGSVHEESQFSGTRVVPSRKCLRVTPDDKIDLIDWPLSHEFFIHAPGSVAARDNLKSELIGAIRALPASETSLFRLSCGKDSRLIAALLAEADYRPCTVTYGTPGGPEVTIAKAVGEAVGLQVENVPASSCKKSLLAANIAQQIRNTDYGFVAGRQLTKPDDELGRYTCVVEGHMHHLRGGFNPIGLFPSDEAAFDNFCGHVVLDSSFVLQERLAEQRERVRVFWDKVRQGRSPNEDLFIAYVDGRPILNPQANNRRRARTHEQLPPMMDERSLLAITSAHVDDLASERLFHSLLADLAPSLVDVPLHGKEWRFIERKRGNRDDNPSGILDRLKFSRVFRRLSAIMTAKRDPKSVGGESARAQEAAPSRNLRLAVDLLNERKAIGLPFDMGAITREADFLEASIDVRKLKKRAEKKGEILDFLWKMILLSDVMGPKNDLKAKLSELSKNKQLSVARELA
ncbi:MAG: hypothetical protein AAGG56_17110 [Pseudomonadota bacterium]